MCARRRRRCWVARRFLIALAVLAAFGLGGTGLVRMMGASATEFQVEGSVLRLSGPISGAASDRLERVLEQTPGLRTLSIGDTPGADDVSWLLGMAHMISAAGLSTRADGAVVNDAILLFLAGAEREIGTGGFHLHSDAVLRDLGAPQDRSASASAERADLVTRILGSAEFAIFMAQTRAENDQYALTEADILRFGLVTR